MYILKNDADEIIAISDTLAYQSNGNPLINEGKLAIASILVDSIQESDVIPEGWEKAGKIYRRVIVHPTPDELRQEGAEAVMLELIERGIL